MDTSSVAVQCNLLNAPPLKKFAHPSASPGASLDDSFISEIDPEETDLDTTLQFSLEDNSTE